MPVLLPLLAAAFAAPSAPPVNVPAQPQLTEQIRQADLALFALYFTGKCDAARFRSMLRPDIEFYHDKDGFDVHSADEFVANYEEKCRSREDPKAMRVHMDKYHPVGRMFADRYCRTDDRMEFPAAPVVKATGIIRCAAVGDKGITRSDGHSGSSFHVPS